MSKFPQNRLHRNCSVQSTAEFKLANIMLAYFAPAAFRIICIDNTEGV